MDDRERSILPFDILSWIGGVCLATAATITFAYSTFETKADYQSRRDDLNSRLERMEDGIIRLNDKFDLFIEKVISGK